MKARVAVVSLGFASAAAEGLRTPPARETAPEAAGLAACWEEAGALVRVASVVDERVGTAAADVALGTGDEGAAWDFDVGMAADVDAATELPIAGAAAPDAPPNENDCFASPAAQGA